ncbi:MAG TPA: 3-hydroxyacyl-CoA dehydrogenase NAD-binding domain-containing protein [Terriglobales bacterium]|nr:3-hydroxyacyl-CoA dehydrogenase NAD-binding domain-containing protein [Terriglobales bacterium]
MKRIDKVTVLGAGTMGARIAAHLANAGVSSFLLDMVPPDADGEARNQIAKAGLEAARKSKPAAFFEPSLAKFVTVGNFDDHLNFVAESDWVIEAIVEDLEIKRNLLKRIESVRKPGAVVTTNTSGLPVGKIAEGFSPEFRRNWFGTHFFNPPRYMRLLEIIPTPETDQAAVDLISHFCDVRLGKGIVVAKDTPNFIANRIGTFSVLNVIRLMQEMDLSIEEVDALTGTAVGWPKSATFRTIDMVGLDILGHVVRNMTTNVHDERSDLKLPNFFAQMLERKWFGDKTKGGFYKKHKTADGEERLGLDWKTLEYRPKQKAKFAALDMAKTVDSTPQRLKMLLGLDGSGPAKGDKAGQFMWTALSELWTYAANRIGEIADSVVEIDRAMRLGFNWELGPFELWDAAGVEPTVERMKKEGRPVSPKVEELLNSGAKSWYEDIPHAASGKGYFCFCNDTYREVQVPAGVWSVEVAKKSNGVVKSNAGASLIDIGDGVACIEFHSKMNTIGADIIQLVTQTMKPGGPGDDFEAFVITNDAQHFSAGANLMLLLMAIQEQEWDDIDMMITAFQGMTQAVKFSPKPVVVAPFGMALGGGCEVTIPAAARQAYAELYMGFAEPGVGLLPAGGGCKEMVLRAVDAAQSIRPDGRGESVEMMEAIKKAFETIALAKISTSAFEARSLGLLLPTDQVTMNRDRVLNDAKERALELARAGYKPPRPRSDIPAPGEGILAALKLGIHIMREGEYITDHEVKIGMKVAEVLCGGNVTPGTPVSEQYFLDLEREGFKSLCGERKTQERIQHTLKTGKPLRN